MEYMKKMLEMGVNMIGGCCGTTPEYTKKMRTLLDGITGRKGAEDYINKSVYGKIKPRRKSICG